MVIINKSSRAKFYTVAGRTIDAGQKSSDIDAFGLTTALRNVTVGLANSCIRLSDEEKSMIERLLALNTEGMAYRCQKTANSRQQRLHELLAVQAAVSAARDAAINSARESAKAIHDERTFTSRGDQASAQDKADGINGVVKAKKLVKTEGPVSLNDLMSDNRFIEENAGATGIKTVLASEEGWDVKKLNEAKAEAQPVKNIEPAVPEAAAEPTAAVEGQAPQTGKRRRRNK